MTGWDRAACRHSTFCPVLQESATYGEHIWFETNVSGDFCYVGEQYCVAKMLVSACCAACCPLVAEQGLSPLSATSSHSPSWGGGKQLPPAPQLSADSQEMPGPRQRGAWQCRGCFCLPTEAVPPGELPRPSLSVPQQKSVSRRKCAACKIVVHTPCIEQLEKVCGCLPLPTVPWGPEHTWALYTSIAC